MLTSMAAAVNILAESEIETCTTTSNLNSGSPSDLDCGKKLVLLLSVSSQDVSKNALCRLTLTILSSSFSATTRSTCT